MKLTPTQIEIERKKFEAFVLTCDYWDEPATYLPNFGFYQDDEHNIAFATWLACRERNNEILITTYCKDYLNLDVVTECLQSQGFTVKSQE